MSIRICYKESMETIVSKQEGYSNIIENFQNEIVKAINSSEDGYEELKKKMVEKRRAEERKANPAPPRPEDEKIREDHQ